MTLNSRGPKNTEMQPDGPSRLPQGPELSEEKSTEEASLFILKHYLSWQKSWQVIPGRMKVIPSGETCFEWVAC